VSQRIARAACACSQTFRCRDTRKCFAIGDTASLDQDGKPLPGVAQVAMQQGRYVGRAIRRRVKGTADTGSRPFRYFDKGSMAVVGYGYAVLESHRLRIRGFPAWLAWAGVHLEFLLSRAFGRSLPAVGMDLLDRASGARN
jgi:NADH dehydrogenase FAD-containing subunit